MSKQIRYLQDIFELAGGSTKLAARLNVHTYTVENWRRTGIPQKYWEAICKHYDVSPGELFQVYKSCRKAITDPSRVN